MFAQIPKFTGGTGAIRDCVDSAGADGTDAVHLADCVDGAGAESWLVDVSFDVRG